MGEQSFNQLDTFTIRETAPAPADAEKREGFEAFEDLATKLVQVPKAEMDQKRKRQKS